MEFIANSTSKWNMAHGSVRTGKTVGTVFAFMHYCNTLPDSKIYIVGHTFDTAYRNVVRLLMESEELQLFRPFLAWSGKKLHFRDKTITILGAKDSGAIGNFQGDTYSAVYCDEMTLYPESIIDMIDTRLSKPYSRGYAAMNPSHPKHKLKEWIDKAELGDPNYYQLHFTLEDNPYVDESYKQRLRDSLSGIFYKRNYLGLWCLAEGAIFDFWDTKIYTRDRAPACADYFIAGIDYGSVNAFACIVVGVSSGIQNQTGKQLWVEAEYYWDPKKTERQKTNSEFANDLQEFLEPYAVKQIYIDPSAEAFQLELRRRGMHVVHANNDVENGIQIMTSEMKRGALLVRTHCKNLIREIETYVWDNKAAEKGWDQPKKTDDHAVDALRYCIASHKVAIYDPYADASRQKDYIKSRYEPTRRY